MLRMVPANGGASPSGLSECLTEPGFAPPAVQLVDIGDVTVEYYFYVRINICAIDSPLTVVGQVGKIEIPRTCVTWE